MIKMFIQPPSHRGLGDEFTKDKMRGSNSLPVAELTLVTTFVPVVALPLSPLENRQTANVWDS